MTRNAWIYVDKKRYFVGTVEGENPSHEQITDVLGLKRHANVTIKTVRSTIYVLEENGEICGDLWINY